jgi:hypothetical protein
MTSMRPARPRLPATLALLAIATLPLASPAANAQAPLAPVLACREEPSDALRLRCYDLEVDRLRAAQARQATAAPPPAAVAPVVATAPAPAAAATTSPANAATAVPAAATAATAVVPSAAPAATPTPAPKPRAARPADSRNVKVTAVTLRKDRTFIATFDNGETWEQFPGDKPVPLQVGLDVQLLRLAFGSMQVVGPRHHWAVTVRQVDEP